MLAYSLRRIPSGLTILAVSSVVIFFLLRATGGDPAAVKAGPDSPPETIAAIRAELGLDRPIIVQFFDWLASLFNGNLGNSLVTNAPIGELIGNGLQATLLLTLAATILAVVMGGTLGVLMATVRNRPVQIVVNAVTGVLLAVPTYVSGVLLIFVFAVILGVLPVGGHVDFFDDPEIAVQYLLLPALCLAMPAAAVVARFLASSMRQVMDEDFIRTGQAKGLSQRRLLTHHIVPNSLPPVFTILGIEIGQMLGGAIVVEAIFAWPGIGGVLAQAVLTRDYFLVQDILLIAVAVFVIMQILTDLAHAAVDSRVRLGV
ncbi:ABC transporter permease [Arthrobacter glacialis]|uniref:ABC transporter permease n=1 Tax=Arthrobacter glacialis TaxID=1664 RepID=UPI000CD3EED9|nr:ABC transporter permease [Arthrobacter glacialis]POH60140.1 ABC transporter permease [Arthrobacter glacialis]